MTSISENLDLNQGFHFQSTRTSAVGHLVSISLAGSALTPDIQVINPTSGTTATVAGVLSQDSWGGGVGDAINLYAYISTANRQLVLTLLQQPMSSISVVFDLATYSFDPIERRSCEHFGSPTPPLRGSIQKQGANFSIHLDSEPGRVASPRNWGMYLTIVPAPGVQNLLVAPTCSNKVIQPWGIT